jgi:uncharacterized protein YigA (DUF484 family)
VTAMDDDLLDVFTLVERLLPGVDLTPSQLAQVRAANTKYYTELFALEEQARAAGRSWTAPSAAERAALQAMLVDDLRSMLTDAQRPDFERRAARLDP